MSGTDEKLHFSQYPKDYFSQAAHLGMTDTSKREKNADPYKYFGYPMYVCSVENGINDEFLTPFKFRHQITLDSYIYAHDDDVIEGEVKKITSI
jgi:type I restriction enzyme R subunit